MAGHEHFHCSFQEVIEAQEKTITNLLKAVTEQHDQLDHQKSKIKNLEEKVENHPVRFQLILPLISSAVCENKFCFRDIGKDSVLFQGGCQHNLTLQIHLHFPAAKL